MLSKRAITKSEGVTPTERELGKLADRTFLSLWSYPGVYRSQRADTTGDGKELCDLLVVFENNIIIFSDKAIEYRETGEPKVAWHRWFRRAVVNSANQIYGAERWLKQHPDRLFLDSSCTEKFPIPLPLHEEMKVHRIVVARGSATAAKKYFGESTATSLMLNSTLESAEDHFSDAALPFTVGQVDLKRGFIHVLDDATLEVVLETLDTITDFTDYLERKERAFTTGPIITAAGEEELLAYYLKQTGDDGKNDFIFPPEADFVGIDQGHWHNFQSHPQRLAQVDANEISYFWDLLIEQFAKHALGDTQYESYNFEHPMDVELILRFLAREGRTRRRLLMKRFGEIITDIGSDDFLKVRVLEPTGLGDPAYVFMVTPLPAGMDYHEFRKWRFATLMNYLHCAKVVMPEADSVIGIAVGRPESAGNSEDIALLDCTEWTEDLQTEAERIQSETGYLKNLRNFEDVGKTYPSVSYRGQVIPSKKLKGRFRNKPCPCGSGRKYKKCCGLPS